MRRWACVSLLLLGTACSRTEQVARKPADTAQPVDAGVAVVDAGIDAAATEALVAPEMPLSPALDGEFLHRLRHLLDAYAANDTALCHDVQLPRKAYVEDYAGKEPARLWDSRIDPAFRKSLHRTHRKLRGRDPEFLGLDVPKPVALSPARERDGWKTPTWRAEGARLRMKAGEHELTVSISSLVHWRGAWYVERL